MMTLSQVKPFLKACRSCHHANISNHDGRSQVCRVCRGLPVIIYLPPACFWPRQRMMNLKPSGDESFNPNPSFTVLSYNLLADIYATQDRHRLCPWQALEWGYRSQNLIQEILHYGADIMCLQEVQSDHYMEFFLPVFKAYGYEGFYKRKNNRYRAVVDGCATFIRRDRLECVEQTTIEFSDLVEDVPAKMSSEPEKWNQLAKRRFCKDNIAQGYGSGFQRPEKWSKSSCSHSEYAYSFSTCYRDVKLWQVNYLLATLKQEKVDDQIPLVLCGDFNSVPGSAVHSLLVKGSVDPSHEDLKVDPCGLLQPTAMFHHSLPLASAYASYNSHSPLMGCAGEPKSTTFACDFKGTLDYIFYSRTSLEVDSLLELIDETAAGPNFSLPSRFWSSDHIALVAKFRWCSSSSSSSYCRST